MSVHALQRLHLRESFIFLLLTVISTTYHTAGETLRWIQSVRTGVWVHREVRVSLADAVHQLGAVPVHAVVGVCGRHLDD